MRSQMMYKFRKTDGRFYWAIAANRGEAERIASLFEDGSTVIGPTSGWPKTYAATQFRVVGKRDIRIIGD